MHNTCKKAAIVRTTCKKAAVAVLLAALIAAMLVSGCIVSETGNGAESATNEPQRIFDFNGMPSVKIVAPLEGQTAQGKTLTVGYEVDGNLSGVDFVHLYLTGLRNTTYKSSFYNRNTRSGSETFENLSDGNYVLNAWLATIEHIELRNPEAHATVRFIIVLGEVNN